jgi:hypothetical protein
VAQALTYSVKFEIRQGKYFSNYSCLPGCEDDGGIHAFHETDENVSITTTYDRLQLSAKGRPSSLLVVHGEQDTSEVGNWNYFGSFWTNQDPNTTYNCHGLLFITDKRAPEILAAPHQTDRGLNLYVESGELFQPKSVSGTNCDAAGAEHFHAFYPATFEPPGDGYLPDMLTARVTLPLRKLRRMRTGDVWGMTFHQGRAKRLPPSDCAGFTGSGSNCRQSLHWTGHLKVTRTG